MIGKDKIDLIRIEAPNLDSTEYGKNIKEVFANIDNNFNKLANTDFLRGPQGDSVILKEYNLALMENQWILDEIIKTVSSRFSTQEIQAIAYKDKNFNNITISVNWYDNLRANPGNLYINEAVVNTYREGSKPVSSMPFIINDARFSNEVYNKAFTSDYTGLSDVSCVVYFDGVDESGKWKFRVLDVFPTLYYDNIQGAFCWKIWGNKTGLIANGPAGKNGEPGNMIIVSRKGGGNNNIYSVGKIFKSGEPTSIHKEDIIKYEGSPAIVFSEDSEVDAEFKYSYWISKIQASPKKDEAFVYCDEYNRVKSKFDDVDLKKAFQRIGQTNDNGLKGLVIPTSYGTGVTSAFALYNRPEVQNSNTLVIKHVNDIDAMYDPADNLGNTILVAGPFRIECGNSKFELTSSGISVTIPVDGTQKTYVATEDPKTHNLVFKLS